MKYFVTLAAIAAISAQPLYAITPAHEGLPEFGEIAIETVGDIAVPAVDVPARQELDQTIDEQHVAEPVEYAFDLPVKNPDAGLYPIEVADERNDIFIRTARKAYGSYEVDIWIEGDTATFKVLKIDSNRYLVRGNEVNLTATGRFSAFGSYYDVSGDIPTPIAETLSFRLNFKDGKSSLVADEPGYHLELRQNYVTGRVDTSVFSKADAACIIALGIAIHRDLPDHDPTWLPYNPPEPWVYHPHHPDPIIRNPWHHHHQHRPHRGPRPYPYPNPWNHNDHNGPGLGNIIDRIVPKPQPPQPKPQNNGSGLGNIIDRIIPKPQPPQPKPQNNGSGLGNIIDRIIPKPQPPQPKPQIQPQPKPRINLPSLPKLPGMGGILNRILKR